MTREHDRLWRLLAVAALVAWLLLVAAAVLAQDAGLDLPVEAPSRVAAPGPRDPPAAPPVPPVDRPPTIYGQELQTESRTLFYVLDVSGSMAWDVGRYTDETGATRTGPRIDRAKAELLRSIASLPASFAFDVLAYDCYATLWRPTLEEATPANKASAAAWVGRLEANGGTGSGPAVAEALRVRENKLVVLLTDGEPSCGEPPGSDAGPYHRTWIRIANRQGARIDVYGIGAEGPLRAWCEGVAADNGGTYVDVR